MEDKVKNIVVLKDLPSNIIEEAIVILKGDKKRMEYIKKHIENENNKKEIKNIDKSKDYIVKEAQMVISNYISTVENQKITKDKKDNKKLEKGYRRMKIATIVMAIVLVLSIL